MLVRCIIRKSRVFFVSFSTSVLFLSSTRDHADIDVKISDLPLVKLKQHMIRDHKGKENCLSLYCKTKEYCSINDYRCNACLPYTTPNLWELRNVMGKSCKKVKGNGNISMNSYRHWSQGSGNLCSYYSSTKSTWQESTTQMDCKDAEHIIDRVNAGVRLPQRGKCSTVVRGSYWFGLGKYGCSRSGK